MSNELPDIQPPSGGFQQPNNWGGGFNQAPFSSSGGGGDASKDMLAYIGLGIAVFSLCAWIIPLCGCPISLAAIGLGYAGLKSNQSTLAKVAIGMGAFTFLATLCVFVISLGSGLSN